MSIESFIANLEEAIHADFTEAYTAIRDWAVGKLAALEADVKADVIEPIAVETEVAAQNVEAAASEIAADETPIIPVPPVNEVINPIEEPVATVEPTPEA